MEVKINKLPGPQIELEIEVPIEEFNGFIDRAALNLSEDLEVKGFRKGKMPKQVVEKEVGEKKILAEAAHLAIQENYRKAILENKIEAISQPEINIKKLAPCDSFVFLAKTAILPEIKLPDYKEIASRIKKKRVKVEEKEIDNALKWLQKSRAKFTLKNGIAEKGDFVEIEYWLPQINAEKEGHAQKDAFILGEGQFVPGFEEQLIGMRAGEEKKEISVTMPENQYRKDLIGKKVVFKVKMDSVQNIELPEINDKFTQSLGNFENLAILRKNIKDGLNLEKEKAESQRIRNEILDKINDVTNYEVPEVLVEREQNQMVESFKKNISEKLKISFEEYLNKGKKTEEEILNSFLPEARKRIKNFFILREIAKKEGIEAPEEEVKKETDRILKHHSDVKVARENLDPVKSHEAGILPKAKLFNKVDLKDLKEYSKERIKNEKVFQLLEDL